MPQHPAKAGAVSGQAETRRPRGTAFQRTVAYAGSCVGAGWLWWPPRGFRKGSGARGFALAPLLTPFGQFSPRKKLGRCWSCGLGCSVAREQGLPGDAEPVEVSRQQVERVPPVQQHAACPELFEIPRKDVGEELTSEVVGGVGDARKGEPASDGEGASESEGRSGAGVEASVRDVVAAEASEVSLTQTKRTGTSKAPATVASWGWAVGAVSLETVAGAARSQPPEPRQLRLPGARPGRPLRPGGPRARPGPRPPEFPRRRPPGLRAHQRPELRRRQRPELRGPPPEPPGGRRPPGLRGRPWAELREREEAGETSPPASSAWRARGKRRNGRCRRV